MSDERQEPTVRPPRPSGLSPAAMTDAEYLHSMEILTSAARLILMVDVDRMRAAIGLSGDAGAGSRADRVRAGRRPPSR